MYTFQKNLISGLFAGKLNLLVSIFLLSSVLLFSCEEKKTAANSSTTDTSATIATTTAKNSEVFNTDGIAIKGYDVVAFFTEKKPVQGNKDFSYEWKNVKWQFANQQNLDLFKNSPEKYLPQYGGYCAYGTAAGHKAPTETDTWTVVEDKLYFNYNKDVKTEWMKNQKALIDSANRKWDFVKTTE